MSSLETQISLFNKATNLYINSCMSFENQINDGLNNSYIDVLLNDLDNFQEKYDSLIDLLDELSFVNICTDSQQLPDGLALFLNKKRVDVASFIDFNHEQLILFYQPEKHYYLLPVDASDLITKQYYKTFKQFFMFTNKLLDYCSTTD